MRAVLPIVYLRWAERVSFVNQLYILTAFHKSDPGPWDSHEVPEGST